VLTVNGELSEKNHEFSDIWRRLKEDPVFFAKVILDFHPFPYQAELLRCKSKRIVAAWGRQSGKTTCIAVKVIHFCFMNPNRTVLIVSRGLRQSMIMFRVIRHMIMSNKLLRKSVVRHTNTMIVLRNGSTIHALPCSQEGANLRGFTAHMVILDEAAFISETVIMNVVFPMIATTDGTIIMLSTPWGKEHIFYRCFTDPDWWTQHVKTEQCPLVKKSFLEEQRRQIGELRYKIEYEAEFIEDINAFFTQEMLRKSVILFGSRKILLEKDIREAEKFTDGEYFLGCDLGKRVDYSVVALFKREYDSDKGRYIYYLVHIKQFPLRTLYRHVRSYIKWLYDKFPIVNGCIDQTGVGESQIEMLRDEIPNIEGVPLYSAQQKQDVMMYLYVLMERGQVAIPHYHPEYGRELITQFNEQRYSYSRVRGRVAIEERGVMTFSHPEGRHDDMLWACALAIYATKPYRRAGMGVVG